MAIPKRIFLFLATNLLVILTISLIFAALSYFGILPSGTRYGYYGGGYGEYGGGGIDYSTLAIICLVWGMVGAFISLGLSRIMAKLFMGVRVIDPNTRDPHLSELVQIVHQLARSAGLPAMPEVGIYDSPEVNAFATGPTKRRALVAVSTGLLGRMSRTEIEGVLGHEITHVANGDMVTMTLLQGVVNAFAMFAARVIASLIAQNGRRDERGGAFGGGIYFLTVMVLQYVFLILGSIVVAAFSRWREFRADAGGARLAGRENMVGALRALQRTHELVDPATQPALATLKINSKPSGMRMLYATHPPLEQRIARLEALRA